MMMKYAELRGVSICNCYHDVGLLGKMVLKDDLLRYVIQDREKMYLAKKFTRVKLCVYGVVRMKFTSIWDEKKSAFECIRSLMKEIASVEQLGNCVINRARSCRIDIKNISFIAFIVNKIPVDVVLIILQFLEDPTLHVDAITSCLRW